MNSFTHGSSSEELVTTESAETSDDYVAYSDPAKPSPEPYSVGQQDKDASRARAQVMSHSG